MKQTPAKMAATIPKKLWEHPNPKETEMYKFMQEVNRKKNLNLQVGQTDRTSMIKRLTRW